MLTGGQRTYLRGLAQKQEPHVQLGRSGVTATVILEMNQALERWELVKVRLPPLERRQRQSWLQQLAEQTGAELAGQVGHTAAFYRQHPDEKKRTVRFPL